MGILKVLKNINNLGTGKREDPAYYWYQYSCRPDGRATLNALTVDDCSSNQLCPPSHALSANVQLYKDCHDDYLNECPRSPNHPYPDPKNCTFDPKSLPYACGGSASPEDWSFRCETSNAVSLPCLDLQHYPPPCPVPTLTPVTPKGPTDYRNGSLAVAGVIATVAVVIYLVGVAACVYQRFCARKRDHHTFPLLRLR
jgi:hypothetical protein